MALTKKLYIFNLLLLFAFFWGNCKEDKKDNSLALAALAMSGEPLGNKSCDGSTETYSWGKFTDQCNGTVKFEGVDGTFGGSTYTAKTLFFAKCTHGQTYNSAKNDCTGTGDSGNNYGAIRVQYCSTADNACDDSVSAIAAGSLFDACNGMNLDGKTWRVSTKDEMQTLVHCADKTMPNYANYNALTKVYVYCGSNNSPLPAISSFFSNTVADIYWSSNLATPFFFQSHAWSFDFTDGFGEYKTKTDSYYARCVSEK
ncbi:MAG: DUF1566 domain-containing protein [Leptospiraceae bacterium]|nr:DUF1566 domain-containing protein [Leptospiraceae bacterium]